MGGYMTALLFTLPTHHDLFENLHANTEDLELSYIHQIVIVCTYCAQSMDIGTHMLRIYRRQNGSVNTAPVRPHVQSLSLP